MLRKSSRGFTLVEILVVITISTALVAVLTRILQSANQVGVLLTTRNSDWASERFLRKQMFLAVPRINAAGLFVGDDDSLMFVTRKSAGGGSDGPLVLAYYAYDSNRRQIVYQESPLPPWWTATPRDDIDVERRLDEFRRQSHQPRMFLGGIEGAKFSYFAYPAGWEKRWQQRGQIPALVRLEFERAGQHREILLEFLNLVADSPQPPLF
jgi:prepilin-type N-terminal cleavage/methylation domain-containing protein